MSASTVAPARPTPGTGGAPGRRRRTRWLETRRGPALLVGPLTVALLVAGMRGGQEGLWHARPSVLVYALRTALVLPFAIVLAVSVWQGQRDGRSGVSELFGSTPRPGWHRLVRTWSASAVAAAAAVVVSWVGFLAFVVWRADDPGRLWLGGSWILALVVAATALAFAVAAGLSLGRLIKARVTAPIAAVAALFLAFLPTNPMFTNALGEGAAWLSPVTETASFVGDMIPAATSWAQIGWFGALAIALLAVAAPVNTRGRSPAVLAAIAGAGVLALACGVSLFKGGDPWRGDPAALRPVCDEQLPAVCVHRVNEPALPDVITALAPVFKRLRGVPGAPTSVTLEPRNIAAFEALDGTPRVVVQLNLRIGLDGRLSSGQIAELRESAAGWVTGNAACGRPEERQVLSLRPGPEADWYAAGLVAQGIALDRLDADALEAADVSGDPAAAAFYQRLRLVVDGLRSADDGTRRDWLARYFAAIDQCETTALPTLLRSSR
ncbi:MAG: hypothetical protein ACRC35_09095 [Angustibacter sp.]